MSALCQKQTLGNDGLLRCRSRFFDSGNIGTAELAQAGVLDVLSSDYVPQSLLMGALQLARLGSENDLASSIRMVTKTPAECCRSQRSRRDRGRPSRRPRLGQYRARTAGCAGGVVCGRARRVTSRFLGYTAPDVRSGSLAERVGLGILRPPGPR